MGKAKEVTTKFRVDLSEFKSGMSQANQEIKLANAQFKATSATLDSVGDSAEIVEAKIKQLNDVLEAEKKKLSLLEKQQQSTKEAEQEAAKAKEDLKKRIASLQKEYDELVEAQGDSSDEAKDLIGKTIDITINLEFNYNSIKSGWSELSNEEGFAPKYTIDISYNDCYEISYNELLLKTIGDVIQTDIYQAVLVDNMTINSIKSDIQLPTAAQSQKIDKLKLTSYENQSAEGGRTAELCVHGSFHRHLPCLYPRHAPALGRQ